MRSTINRVDENPILKGALALHRQELEDWTDKSEKWKIKKLHISRCLMCGKGAKGSPIVKSIRNIFPSTHAVLKTSKTFKLDRKPKTDERT